MTLARRGTADRSGRQRTNYSAARLDGPIEEATVDAHDESEEKTPVW
jgi:hypothetical protein